MFKVLYCGQVGFLIRMDVLTPVSNPSENTMMMKKPVFAGALLSTVFVLAGCQTIPQSEHDQVVMQQQKEFEKEISKKDQAHALQQQDLEAQLAELKMQKQAAELQAAQPATAQVSNASVESSLFPPNAELGHCYSRVLIPASYKTITDKVLVTPASEQVTIAPAKYKKVAQRVVVNAAYERLEIIPATYKTVNEKVMTSAAHTHLETVPAIYETVVEKVLDKPAHTVWKRGAGFQSSALETKIDNGTGEIMCLVEVPASYRTITKKVLKTPARAVEEHHPAEYTTVAKRVVDQPSATRTITVPAEYETVMVRQIETPEREVRTQTPAVYNDVARSEKTSEASLTWEEVLCEDNMTPQTITQLQRLLKTAGNYAGPIDGVYGPMTERAVNGYAEHNGLPTGSRLVSLKTAEHIGLKAN